MTVKKFPRSKGFCLFVCLQAENKVKGLLMPLVVNEDKCPPAVKIAGMGKPLVTSLWKVSA